MLNAYRFRAIGGCEWHLERQALAAALLERWPLIGVTDPASLFVWSLRTARDDPEDPWMDGRMADDWQSCGIWADPRTAAELAVWLRDRLQVPFEMEADEGSDLLMVDADTKWEEICSYTNR